MFGFYKHVTIILKNFFRPDVQPLVGKVPQEDLNSKATTATVPTQTAAKPQAPVLDTNRTDPVAGTTAPGTAVLSAPAARGSSLAPGIYED